MSANYVNYLAVLDYKVKDSRISTSSTRLDHLKRIREFMRLPIPMTSTISTVNKCAPYPFFFDSRHPNSYTAYSPVLQALINPTATRQANGQNKNLFSRHVGTSTCRVLPLTPWVHTSDVHATSPKSIGPSAFFSQCATTRSATV